MGVRAGFVVSCSLWLLACSGENGALFRPVPAPEVAAEGLLGGGTPGEASAPSLDASSPPAGPPFSTGNGPSVVPGEAGGVSPMLPLDGEDDDEIEGTAPTAVTGNVAEEEPPAVVSSAEPERPRACRSPAEPLLLSFDDLSNGPAQALFGDFVTVLSGGTYIYPAADAASGADAPAGLSSDVTGGDWRITGWVATHSGFGIFLDCHRLDASAFDGIAFRISGTIEGEGTLTFLVGTASNEVSREWLVGLGNQPSAGPSFGRCTPAAGQFDGTCQAARVTVPVTIEGSEVEVRFDELGGGSPLAAVSPDEITSIAWALSAPVATDGGDVVPYAVDLRLDDIRFLEP